MGDVTLLGNRVVVCRREKLLTKGASRSLMAHRVVSLRRTIMAAIGGRLGATPEPIAPNQHQVRCVATSPTVPGPQSPNRAGSCFSPYGRSYGRHVLVREFCVLLS